MKLFSHAYLAILKLALPLIFIQLCQASLGLVDTLIAGRYGYHDLAGVGLGSNLWTPVFILFTGVLYVLVPKLSQAAAVQNDSEISYLFLRGKKLAIYLSVFGFLIIHLLAWISPLLIADSRVADICQNYLRYMAFGFPGLVYLLLFRFACEGNSKLRPVMVTSLLLLVLNTLLNVIFVHGWGPLSAMGGAGCGLATCISIYLTLLYTRVLARRAVPQIKFSLNTLSGSQHTPANPLALLVEGLPIGIALLLEVLAIVTLAFFAASLGVEVVAAHQIAINIAMVCFMVPVALSSATTIRIAHFRAQNDKSNKQYTGLAAMSLAVLYGTCVAVLLLLLGNKISAAFSDDQSVILITAGLIGYVALFQLFDAIQIVAAGILRGLEEFSQPMLVMLVIYWVLVVPISYMVGVKGWGVASGSIDSIWFILALGLGMAALLLTLISRRHLRQ